MKKFLLFVILLLIFASALKIPAFPLARKDSPAAKEKAAPLADSWKKWLDEVKPIMTALELSTFKQLETEEDRKRFQDMFWKARDPNAQKPESENEYKREFYWRLKYAKTNFNGGNTDRGKIYVIMGKPFEIKDFSGYQNLVDCQMWIYQNENRPGFLPFINIIFFRPRNMGDYQLFYPGIHTARDLLDPNTYSTMISSIEAYQYVETSSSELAQASLSVIPGEVDPYSGTGLSSSNFAFSKIFSLPEREMRSGYLINFKMPQGFVNVSVSTQRIMGYGSIAVSVNRDITFLNFALMPQWLEMIAGANNLYKADIRLYIRIEDAHKNVVYQDERKIDLKLTAAKKKEIDDRKIIFHDFIPIIPGDFLAQVTFMNKDTEEFFSHEEKISIPEKILPVLTGFKANEIKSDGFISFSMDRHLLFSDPRSVFNQNDSLEGIVMTDSLPEITLNSLNEKNNSLKVENISKLENGYKFSQPLTELAAGKYLLSVQTAGGRSFSQIIQLESSSYNIPKPMAFEKTEPASARNNYLFILAQEYLNCGQVSKALEFLSRLPESLLNSTTLPVIGRAHYLNQDYAQAIAVLEKEQVEKNYVVLIMLANSAIELKQFQKAVNYLERVRKYNDSAEINYLLAATYLSLGDKDKAKIYYDRIKQLVNKE
ncbi:MAG: GWxTD domain-containing protein [Candidatus Aminicenantales bacterium]